MMGVIVMQFSVKASLDALSFLLDRIDSELASLGISKENRAPILLSADEVFSNIVMHGQLNATEDFIQLRLFRIDNRLCIDICDWGPAFDPTLEAKAAISPASEKSIDDLPLGGWGLLLVKTLAINIQYARENGMNHFTMQFPLPQSFDGAKSST